MSDVIVYTDGACSGNPGPGGWAAVLSLGSVSKEISGGENPSTNNRMELMAAIAALEALTRPCSVTVFADSAYMVNAVEKGWLRGWQRGGWRTKKKEPVLNQDLWQRLIAQLDRHTVSFSKVKGHAGVELNERCDELARAAAQAAT